MQYAFPAGIRDYVLSKKDLHLDSSRQSRGCGQTQQEVTEFRSCMIFRAIFRAQNHHMSFSRYCDPRVWVREGEKTLSQRLGEALDDFNTKGQI